MNLVSESFMCFLLIQSLLLAPLIHTYITILFSQTRSDLLLYKYAVLVCYVGDSLLLYDAHSVCSILGVDL